MSIMLKKWNELAEVKAELAARDWFFATSGNLSLKVTDAPLTFLVTASGKDKRKQTSEDFLLIDADGKPVEDTHLKPSAETLLHVEVYRRTNAGCVLHVHTVDNNIISDVYAQNREAVFSGQEIIKAFGIWEENAEVRIPIIDNYADIPTLANEFAKHIDGDTGAVLIQNHGITVWGRDAFEAKKHLEAWEFLFSWQVKRLLLQRVAVPLVD
ncbi:methylthioribulose 1-phosphate dehydratase [Geobacillus thermodenitrificans]|jgi:methylthioribulose-1-phosphate dehydratase|uniref:methylthioribulose 1-phosphate dehydratase n=1 Tax=Geobacillus thermodenitrificans TaxID=33940 RepID=UPI000C05A537|nr:methylthioribulose 1-phosphate dehydratase [Geobacillus thermodenitrificans]ATO36690.1 methylthioribulose-1-phosphate dehydratase [Geobacillus thermodenitrificans]PTR48345.1 methylthioribulose-1-phosphate dehydratase [Geobacillus thermodenitrificans]